MIFHEAVEGASNFETPCTSLSAWAGLYNDKNEIP